MAQSIRQAFNLQETGSAGPVEKTFSFDEVQQGLNFYTNALLDMALKRKSDNSVIEYPAEARIKAKTPAEKEKYGMAFNNQRMISMILSEANNQGRLDELLDTPDPATGITTRKALADKGYMVVHGPDKAGDEIVYTISHWETRRGEFPHPYDPDNSQNMVPLPDDVRHLKHWKKTFGEMAGNETKQEQAAISTFVQNFAAKKDETGFTADDKIVILDTDLSNPKRSVFLALEMQEQFGKEVFYTGVGLKPDFIQETRDALDKAGIKHDLRQGKFGEGIKEGFLYTPKDKIPYAPLERADVVFQPFGAPYFGRVDGNAPDAVGMALKDGGIVISLTNKGHTLSKVKDGVHKDKFRPDTIFSNVKLDDSQGAAEFNYGSTLKLPDVPQGFWGGLVESGRAAFGHMADEAPQKLRDVLSVIFHVDLTALPREDRAAVIDSTRNALANNDNKIDYSLMMTVAPGPNASPALRAAIKPSMPVAGQKRDPQAPAPV